MPPRPPSALTQRSTNRTHSLPALCSPPAAAPVHRPCTAPQGNTEDVGEDYNVEAADDAPRPFQCILDAGLKRTSTGSKVFAALKVRGAAVVRRCKDSTRLCCGRWCWVGDWGRGVVGSEERVVLVPAGLPPVRCAPLTSPYRLAVPPRLACPPCRARWTAAWTSRTATSALLATTPRARSLMPRCARARVGVCVCVFVFVGACVCLCVEGGCSWAAGRPRPPPARPAPPLPHMPTCLPAALVHPAPPRPAPALPPHCRRSCASTSLAGTWASTWRRCRRRTPRNTPCTLRECCTAAVPLYRCTCCRVYGCVMIGVDSRGCGLKALSAPGGLDAAA